MSRRPETVDVLIIGSGAGGGPLAAALSSAGLQVLVLEKGPRYSRSDFVHDELRQRSEHVGFFIPTVEDEPHVVVDDGASPVNSSLGWIACCVGGGTCHMDGAFYRFRPTDFRMRTTFGAYHELEDWPYGYEDLEPYYCRAERAIGVSGRSSSCVGDGPRSEPLPMPPLAEHRIAAVFDRVCERHGWHPYTTPRAINSQPYDGRPACGYCSVCTGYGCPTGARGSVQETVLAAAEKTGRCEIREGAMVREISARADGLADGAIYIDRTGGEHRIRARIICVCCSAVESARLLMISKSALWPDGIANGSGVVGRHLQFHSYSGACGRFFRRRHPELWGGDDRGHLGRSIADFYELPGGVGEIGKGGLLRFEIAQPSPIGAAQALSWRVKGGKRIWGRELKARLSEYFRDVREIDVEVLHDFIPNKGCYVSLDDRVKDKWGLPVARIHLSNLEHHAAAGEWLTNRGLDLLASLGADELEVLGVGGMTRNLIHGTCRAGVDRSRSVLNEFCQTHEVRNLFVVDGSFMPTSGSALSTLTILANSFRTADYILAQARRGEL